MGKCILTTDQSQYMIAIIFINSYLLPLLLLLIIAKLFAQKRKKKERKKYFGIPRESLHF